MLRARAHGLLARPGAALWLVMAVSAGCADPLPAPARRGLLALHQHGCQGCHTIPGVTGSDRQVGPPLAGLARRSLIAGRLPNTQDNLVAWIRAPQQIKPDTAMPNLGVTQADASDMAAYLARLD